MAPNPHITTTHIRIKAIEILTGAQKSNILVEY